MPIYSADSSCGSLAIYSSYFKNQGLVDGGSKLFTKYTPIYREGGQQLSQDHHNLNQLEYSPSTVFILHEALRVDDLDIVSFIINKGKSFVCFSM
jgi:hypothetical protein